MASAGFGITGAVGEGKAWKLPVHRAPWETGVGGREDSPPERTQVSRPREAVRIGWSSTEESVRRLEGRLWVVTGDTMLSLSLNTCATSGGAEPRGRQHGQAPLSPSTCLPHPGVGVQGPCLTRGPSEAGSEALHSPVSRARRGQASLRVTLAGVKLGRRPAMPASSTDIPHSLLEGTDSEKVLDGLSHQRQWWRLWGA